MDVKFSSSEGFQEDRLFKYLQHIPFVLVNFAIIAFVIALARPQDAKSWEQTKTLQFGSFKFRTKHPSQFVSGHQIGNQKSSHRHGLGTQNALQFVSCYFGPPLFPKSKGLLLQCCQTSEVDKSYSKTSLLKYC